MKTPRQLSFGTPASKGGLAPSPATFGRNLEAEFFANAQHILSTPDFSLLQVDNHADLSLVPQTESEHNGAAAVQPDNPVESTSSFRSASNIQTPPPTTTSASKKQGKKVQIHHNEEQESGSETRRRSAPLLPKTTNEANRTIGVQRSPDQYTSFDFSPNVFGPGFAPPATAPAHPQQGVFWEPDASTSGLNLDFADLGNPFGTHRQGGLDPFVSNHPSISNSHTTMSDSFLDFGNDDTPIASFSQAHANQAITQTGNFHDSTRAMHGVDPSLLFSSPGKLSDAIHGSLPLGQSVKEESLQPYAYQVQEARREKAYSGISKPKRRRKPSVDSPAVRAALETLREDSDRRPAVRRSITDSAVSRYGHESGSSRTSSAHGRSSPLKRIHESRRSSRKPKHRTSIALTIDENGRARAEARVVNQSGKEVPEDAMDVDSTTASSETGSESSSGRSDDEIVTSFAPQLPGPKLGRFSSSASHSQKSSYTSFYSSASRQDGQPSLPDIKQRPISSSRKSGLHSLKSRQGRRRIPEDPESEAETVLDSDMDDDNAQNQLRKVMQGKRKASAPQPRHHLYSPLGISTAVFGNDPALSSPTTVTDPDLPTPSSGHSSASDSIRCLCHSINDEGQMIQWYD